ncbi:hypothetical protein HID58_005900 [Brassica napus]|uniref:Uncharacterized protein n=1 Tax=Brassica napus TaxID=3708 RepID=A0ABQ8E9X8_BRANA|nr:hypothetical protein HID58_005900 [Brassica napus]
MKVSDVSDSVKRNGKAAIPSNFVKPVSQAGVSSGDDGPMKSKGGTAVSKSPIKPVTKTGVSSSVDNPVKSRGATAESVIQGFIPYGRIETYLPHMKAGCTYRLNKFFGSKSKTIYRVADPDVTISFSWNSALTALEDSSIRFPEDRIYYIGHIKLVNGKVPSDGLLLDEAEIAVSRRVELHVQTHDEKFKASGGTARVILVTTLNPKRFGGVLSLSAMASSGVFMDSDVQETLFYLSWLNSNLDVASRVNAEVIIKPEPSTLGELFTYMNQAFSKVAWFECTSIIDDVVHGSGWYLTKLSVYDHNDQAVFVVLGDAGEELNGKKANELVERYYQVNDSVGGDHMVPVPQAMVDTIGQTRKFIVKVSNHNLTAKTQTLTVTKVLPPDAPESEDSLGENVDEIGDNEEADNAAELEK